MASIMVAPRRAARYRLAEMADDAVAVMAARGWSRAHILGASMGGMIAQTLAINHPERVISLTSISSTPSPRIGRPALAASRIMAMRAGRNGEELADRMVRQFRIIGSPGYPLDESWLRDYAHKAFARGYNPAGGRRQLAAVMASGSRTRDLSRVHVPTLVVHGSDDLLIRPWAGRATATAVRNARFVLHPGMGHDLPSELWPTVAADVRELARSAA
jgi:pimeloyl-ACP methyl ester carboxylesterase